MRRTARTLLAATFLWATLSSPAAAHLEIYIPRIGFPTLAVGDVIRNGVWTPVIVEVSLVGEPAFDGQIRLSQFDRDGDAVVDAVEVHLRAETGGTQRYTLYTLPGPRRGEARFTVDVLNADGEAVEVVSQGELTLRPAPAEQPSVLADDELLIMSVSREAVGRIRDFVDASKQRNLRPRVQVGHMSTQDLPELWHGLEAVDAMVWDDARPDELTVRQLDALLEWVRQGGTLLLAASRTAGAVALDKTLSDALPAELGEVQPVDNLPEVREALLGAPSASQDERIAVDWISPGFPSPVPVVQCRVRDGAKVIAAESGKPIREGQRSLASDVLTEGAYGHGRIIFSGVALQDLFSGQGEAIDFFNRVFHLEDVGESENAYPAAISIFDQVTGFVSFSASASAYLLLAGMTSIAYVLVATFGSWGILQRRGWQKHSWTAFALLAIAASVLTVGAVNWMRGFGERLHQLTVVDLDADRPEALATVFLGLKTSRDKRVDVWLPPDPTSAVEPERTDCFLRPLPANSDPLAAVTRFADPDEYRAMPASALLSGVRVRGTLRQFEGRWSGFLQGRVTGDVTIVRGKFTPESYIVNELGVDLEQCMVLQARVNPEQIKGPRDMQIQAFPIGDLPSGPQPVNLVARSYRPEPDESLGAFLQRTTLRTFHEDWSRAFSGLLRGLRFGDSESRRYAVGEERKALLLLSTVGEFDPASLGGTMETWMGQTTFSRDRLRYLEMTDRLDTESIMLVGFAREPGPARLFMREGSRAFRPVEPDPRQAMTMYRIRVPVRNLGTGRLEELEDLDEEGTPGKGVEGMLDELTGDGRRGNQP